MSYAVRDGIIEIANQHKLALTWKHQMTPPFYEFVSTHKVDWMDQAYAAYKSGTGTMAIKNNLLPLYHAYPCLGVL